MIVRRMGEAFRFEDLESAQVRIGYPEESYLVVGASIWLPALEPYLIRTMREAIKEVKDPELREAMGIFNSQEGQHYRQHQRFNDVIKARGFPGLARYEEAVQADFQRLTRTKSLRFNVAYAACFEAITTAGASVVFETDTLRHYQTPARQLFEWHLAEEVEHRMVAWDVYQELYGGYWYRIAVMFYMLRHILSWTAKVMIHMLRTDPDYPKGYDVKLRHRLRAALESEGVAIPAVFRLFSPRYSPHEIPLRDPAKVAAVGKLYEELANEAGASTTASSSR